MWQLVRWLASRTNTPPVVINGRVQCIFPKTGNLPKLGRWRRVTEGAIDSMTHDPGYECPSERRVIGDGTNLSPTPK